MRPRCRGSDPLSSVIEVGVSESVQVFELTLTAEELARLEQELP